MVKRSKFWTVVFSFLPGAGHMFMGFMKHGVSIMAIFFGVLFLSSWIRLDELRFLLPVLWFYSFFDCINKRFSTDERFMRFEDKYLFEDYLKSRKCFNAGKYNVIISILLIVVGAYIVLNNVLDMINWNLIIGNGALEVVDNIISQLPQVAIGVLIVVFGVKLICGKKKEISENEQN